MRTVREAEILIPAVAEPEKWAVVSCDQFTSQKKYWKKLDEYIDGAPSALRIIFPEVYLEDGDADKRIADINRTMRSYLNGGVFRELKDSFVLVRRETEYGMSRLGLVVAVDLEDYSFIHPNNSPIRSTEGVVVGRIPPRLKIRQGAPIELPHIILLIDDREKRVIEPLYERRDEFEPLYDFKLNMGGGRVEGYRVDSDEVIAIFDDYEKSVKGIYGKDTDFIFAVGDGNHSLATAQAHWNNIKDGLSEKERETHPARFALCEVENLHSDGIAFEPIHRFVFGSDDAEFVGFMSDRLKGNAKLKMFSGSMGYSVPCNDNAAEAISEIQAAIDEYLEIHPECYVDYIHGSEHLAEIAAVSEGVAVEMPKIAKEELFQYVADYGTLCRKAFSMGEAEEKRYYIEAKRIIP